MMRCITKDLAKQMESCIQQTHIEVTKQYPEGTILEINGGAACFSGFESYLSQVVGWGFATQPQQYRAEIERIEHFYKSLNHPRVDIELCPFVGNELAIFLSHRGYFISELNNVSALDLKAYPSIEHPKSALKIREINPDEHNDWALCVAIGFGAREAKKQFLHYIQSKGVRAFAAYDHEKIVAGATIAMHDAFGDLGVTSTLPDYRGKGLQKQLVLMRLHVAKQAGLSWATVTTQPGSISDENIQKIGFHCAYTRIKMTLEYS